MSTRLPCARNPLTRSRVHLVRAPSLRFSSLRLVLVSSLAMRGIVSPGSNSGHLPADGHGGLAALVDQQALEVAREDVGRPVDAVLAAPRVAPPEHFGRLREPGEPGRPTGEQD